MNVGSLAFLSYSKIFLRNSDSLKMNIPVAVITDVDLAEYEKIGDSYQPKVIPENDRSEKIIDLKTKFEDENVKAFISSRWTLEYALLKSSSLSAHFQRAVKTVHSRIDEDNFEFELATKLLKKTLGKTEIAYQLAALIDEDSLSSSPEIIFQENDSDAVTYLLEAIKYVVGD